MHHSTLILFCLKKRGVKQSECILNEHPRAFIISLPFYECTANPGD